MTDSMRRGRNPIVMIAAGLIALGIAVIAAIFIYFNFIRDDAPDAFELTDASAEAADDTGGDADDDADDDAAADDDSASDDAGDTASDDAEAEDAATGDASGSADGLDGTWVIGPSSEAGYRVVEDLGNIQDFEAVGRTSDVTGSIEIEGTAIVDGFFEVEVATITSDDQRRDRAFQGADVMDAATFPTAVLALTDDIDIGSIPAEGTPIETTAAGELTLRDVTQAVTFPVQAQLIGGEIEIVAAIELSFADYGIQNPSNTFVSVRDEGTVEVLLRLIPG